MGNICIVKNTSYLLRRRKTSRKHGRHLFFFFFPFHPRRTLYEQKKKKRFTYYTSNTTRQASPSQQHSYPSPSHLFSHPSYSTTLWSDNPSDSTGRSTGPFLTATQTVGATPIACPGCNGYIWKSAGVLRMRDRAGIMRFE